MKFCAAILLLTCVVTIQGRRHQKKRHHDNMDVSSHDSRDPDFDGYECAFGYEYSMKDGCVDVNECMEFPCKHGQTCQNLMGTFECLCPRGHKLNETNDCVDINECDLGYCGKHTCINSEGSYSCICPTGSKQIGRYCRDINECVMKPCEENSEYCINTRGSYRCECNMGFVRNRTNMACVDVDECANGGMCTAYGEHCVNTPGGYECQCNEGYEHDASGRYCIDTNECDFNTSCSTNAECINTKGSFYCRCHRGFVKNDEGECTDVRDCSLGEGQKCQWKCKDVPGSFECLCPSGYDRSEFACIDVNECDNNQPLGGSVYYDVTTDNQVCGKNSTCVNTRGGRECVETGECPSDEYYQHVTRTDEFSKRQITTNACRRRCKAFRGEPEKYKECKQLPMSINNHYVDITSNLKAPKKIFRIKMKPRRRRQRYEFEVKEGDEEAFGLKQVSSRSPTAYLYTKKSVTGPGKHRIKVDMTTYNKAGKKRDTRMVTVTIFVSQYEF